MEETYAIAQKRSLVPAVRNKRHYDKEVRFVDLQLHDRMLVRNMSERGGSGKLSSFREKEVYVLVRRKDPLTTLFQCSCQQLS